MPTDWLYCKTWNKYRNGLFLSVVIYKEFIWYSKPVIWMDDDVVRTTSAIQRHNLRLLEFVMDILPIRELINYKISSSSAVPVKVNSHLNSSSSSIDWFFWTCSSQVFLEKLDGQVSTHCMIRAERRRGGSTHPCGTPVLAAVVLKSNCFHSVRKSDPHPLI